MSDRFDQESKQLFKNSTWVFLSNFVGIGLAFLRSVVVARILGAETFGSYAIVVAFVGIVQEFLNLNLGTALIKYGATWHHEGRMDKLAALARFFVKTATITLLISVGIVALISSQWYQVFISRPGLETYLVLYAAAAGTKYFNSISSGMLRLYYKFRLNSVIQIAMDIVESLLVIAAVLLYGNNLQVFFTTVIAAAFLNGVICNVMAWWELRPEFAAHASAGYAVIRNEMKNVWRFVAGNSLGNSLKSLMSQGDVLLLGAYSGPAQVAYYTVAKKLGYSILVLTDPLMNSIFPQFSKLLAARRYTEIRTMLRRITLAAAAPAVLFLPVVFFLSDWIIVTVFGAEYAPSGRPFFWLVAGAVFGAITFWTLPLVQSMGLVMLRLVTYSVSIAVGSAVALQLLPQWKSTGMAVALLCANVLINFTFIYYTAKQMRSGALPVASA